jgi:urease accessory protein
MKKLILAVVWMIFCAAPAFAHTNEGTAFGLITGFMHPILGLDHLITMVMVGVLAAMLGGKMVYMLPATFVSALIVGGVVGIAGIEIDAVETMIVVSVIVIALLSIVKKSLPAWSYAVIIGAFGIFHGIAHGYEMPLNMLGYEYALGFASASALLHILGVMVQYAMQIALRRNYF